MRSLSDPLTAKSSCRLCRLGNVGSPAFGGRRCAEGLRAWLYEGACFDNLEGDLDRAASGGDARRGERPVVGDPFFLSSEDDEKLLVKIAESLRDMVKNCA